MTYKNILFSACDIFDYEDDHLWSFIKLLADVIYLFLFLFFIFFFGGGEGGVRIWWIRSVDTQVSLRLEKIYLVVLKGFKGFDGKTA